MSESTPKPSARGKVDLVGHVKLPAGDLPAEAVTNIIVKTDDPELDWVQSTTERFGDWRAECRSTYIRWALCLNGLDLAAKSYASRSKEDKAFIVQSLRPNENGDPDMVAIAQWPFAKTGENHRLCVQMVCAFGLIDLFACLEELVFDAYMIWHESHPTECLVGSGDENKALRRLFRDRTVSEEAASAWESAWSARKLEWRRNRAYDGLEKVLLAYCGHAKLKKPATYVSGPKEWSESLAVVAHVRNMLVHGATHADQKLADMGKLPHCVGFQFELGEPLELNLGHLMNVECFADALLTALNLAFAETYLPAKGGKAK